MQRPDRTHVYHFLAGYPAAVGTVKLLCQTARDRSTHPRIRGRVRQLFAGLPPQDHDGEIRAVWEHVLEHVRYQRDPVGVEYVVDPVELDQEVDEGLAAEDCEGLALYAATLLASAGIPSEFELQGRDPSQPKRYRHCALSVINPRTQERTSFDPVGAFEYGVEAFDLGDTLHRDGDPIERWNLDGEKVSMRSSNQDLRGALFGDAIPDSKSGDSPPKSGFDVQTFVDNLFKTGESLAPAFGPVGSIVGDVIKVGDDVYHVATGQKLGKAIDPKAAAAAKKAAADKKKKDEASSSSLIKAGVGAGAGWLLLKALV